MSETEDQVRRSNHQYMALFGLHQTEAALRSTNREL
jgi:hypothetical protein